MAGAPSERARGVEEIVVEVEFLRGTNFLRLAVSSVIDDAWKDCAVAEGAQRFPLISLTARSSRMNVPNSWSSDN